MNMRFRLGLALFSLTFITVACNLAGPATDPVTPATEAPPSPAISSPTAIPATDTPLPATELPATETPGPEPTLTEHPPPTPRGERWLSPQPQIDLQAGGFTSYPQSVLDFLNAGGTLEALDQGL